MSNFYNRMLDVKGCPPCPEALQFINLFKSVEDAWVQNRNLFWMLWYLLDFDGSSYANTILRFETYLKETDETLMEKLITNQYVFSVNKLKELHPKMPKPSIYSAQELANIINNFIDEARRNNDTSL